MLLIVVIPTKKPQRFRRGLKKLLIQLTQFILSVIFW